MSPGIGSRSVRARLAAAEKAFMGSAAAMRLFDRVLLATTQ